MSSLNIETLRTAVHRKVCKSRDLSLYAILDAARSEAIHPALSNSGAEFVCLHRDAPRALALVAPHLVKLEPGSDFAEWVIREGWGKSWGIFLLTVASTEVLEEHFRKIIRVRNEAGETLFFRYYDPRVLRAYVPTCKTNELEQLFGPTSCVFAESEDGEGLVAYYYGDSRLANPFESRVLRSFADAEAEGSVSLGFG
jgi:hypothetical protein